MPGSSARFPLTNTAYLTAAGAGLYDVNEVRGGSAYGAGTLAGADGSRQPSKLELDFAQHQVCCAFCWVRCLERLLARLTRRAAGLTIDAANGSVPISLEASSLVASLCARLIILPLLS